MREGQVDDFVVVLAQPENGLLLVVIPDDDVGVLAFLARSQEVSCVRHGQAGD